MNGGKHARNSANPCSNCLEPRLLLGGSSASPGRLVVPSHRLRFECPSIVGDLTDRVSIAADGDLLPQLFLPCGNFGDHGIDVLLDASCQRERIKSNGKEAVLSVNVRHRTCKYFGLSFSCAATASSVSLPEASSCR